MTFPWSTPSSGRTNGHSNICLISGGQALPKKSRPVVNVHGIYKARDGYVTLAAVTQEGWENLTRVMGKPELSSDPRFHTPP